MNRGIGITGVSLVLALLANYADADTAPAPVLATLQRVLPGYQVLEDSPVSGDLNQDQQPDWALVLSSERQDDREYSIAVLFADAKGSYRLAAHSKTWYAHERINHQLVIKSGSLFLELGGMDGCCIEWSSSFQFKLKQDVLRLIGYRNQARYLSDETTVERQESLSLNVVTGDKIEQRQRGKQKVESKSQLAERPTLSLQQFSYDELRPDESRAFGYQLEWPADKP